MKFTFQTGYDTKHLIMNIVRDNCPDYYLFSGTRVRNFSLEGLNLLAMLCTSVRKSVLSELAIVEQVVQVSPAAQLVTTRQNNTSKT